MTATQQILMQHAWKFRELGISTVPFDEKKPLAKWSQYRDNLADEAEIETMFDNPAASQLAIVLGPATGRLECISVDSFDGSALRLITQINDPLKFDGCNFVIVKTPKGGFHVFYESAEHISPNKILSRDGEHSSQVYSHGKCVIVPPSAGYELVEGNWADIILLDPDQVSMLHKIATNIFNQKADDDHGPGKN